MIRSTPSAIGADISRPIASPTGPSLSTLLRGVALAKGWRKPEGAIVVARPSRWGNPFRIEVFGRAEAVRLRREGVLGEKVSKA